MLTLDYRDYSVPLPAVFDLLRSLKELLDRLGLRWYLFGAQAVVLHGRPRLTEDVDVTVELGSLSQPAFVREMQSAGFQLEQGIDEDFIAQTRVLPFTHTSGVPLDIVLAGSGLETLIFDQVQPVALTEDLAVPVVAPEHLVVLKILAGRPKDIEDVRGILMQCGDEIDHDAIRELLGQLEEALDQSDLLTTFAKLGE